MSQLFSPFGSPRKRALGVNSPSLAQTPCDGSQSCWNIILPSWWNFSVAQDKKIPWRFFEVWTWKSYQSEAFNLEFHFVRGRMQEQTEPPLGSKVSWNTERPSSQTKFAKMAKIHFTREMVVVPIPAFCESLRSTPKLSFPNQNLSLVMGITMRACQLHCGLYW